MKAKKFFVRAIDSDYTETCSRSRLLYLILDSCYYPLRVTPIDSTGDLVHELTFLVGDDFSLSFLFNDKTI